MEKIIVDLNNDHSVGLGDNLCLLSSLANIRPQVELQVTNKHNTFDRLTQYKRIFRIPNSMLTVVETDVNGLYPNTGWPNKLFTDYYKPTHVNVNGSTHRIDLNKEKKCIAVACSFDQHPTDNDKWPWCRGREHEYWGRVMAKIKKAGYEVITVDQAQHSLEDKVELLTRHCKAIVSYEGGMAHLAHMLRLPCFLLDWKLPSPSTTLSSFHCEFVHRTNSVYILRDDEEFMSWTDDEFTGKINDLRRGLTNNRLVNGSCKLSFQGPGIHGRLTVTDTTGRIMLEAPSVFGDNKMSELLKTYYTY
jgi:hypothetical protein